MMTTRNTDVYAKRKMAAVSLQNSFRHAREFGKKFTTLV